MARATTATRKTTSTASRAKATTATKPKTKSPTKGVTAPKSAAKPKVVKAVAEVESTKAAVVVSQDFKKKDLIEKATARSGVKKQFVKPAIEAALAILGEAIEAGEDLNLEPFGKLKIQRDKEVPNGKVYMMRLRRKDPSQKEDDVSAADEA